MIKSVMSKMVVEAKKAAVESQTTWRKRLSSQSVATLAPEDTTTRAKMPQNSGFIHRAARSLPRSYKPVHSSSLLRSLITVRAPTRRQQAASLRQAGASHLRRLINSISRS